MEQGNTQSTKSKALGDVLKSLFMGLDSLVIFVRESIGKFDNLTETNYNLACQMVAQGRIKDAIFRFRMTLWINPNHIDSLHNLACIYHHQGLQNKALELFTRVLKIKPDHQAAIYMIASINPSLLRPEVMPKTMPYEMAVDYFDNISGNYDYQMQMSQYQMPALLHQFMRTVMGDQMRNNLLDLGCGTGLCGAQFREEFTNTVGVDLSNSMLDMAYRKTDRRGVLIYTRLIHQDLRYYLTEAEPESMEIALCISVFPYLGEVDEVFSGVRKVLRKGGLFACSFDPYIYSGDFGLMPTTGDFGHNIDYILRLAKQNGFEVVRTGPVPAYAQRLMELCIFRVPDPNQKTTVVQEVLNDPSRGEPSSRPH